jgi:hypothetical protein
VIAGEDGFRYLPYHTTNDVSPIVLLLLEIILLREWVVELLNIELIEWPPIHINPT